MLTLLAVLVVFIVLILAEYLSRFKGVHSEITRKIVHILVGVFVAFWPLFLSWNQIQLLSLGFLLVVLISIKLNIFKAVHAVARNTSGEVLFAFAIGLLATFVQDTLIFMAAMLSLSLADGLAAIMGKKFGSKNEYRVFGDVKSVIGSLTFLFVSAVVMGLYIFMSGAAPTFGLLIWLPLLLTVVENVSTRGTDNFTIPAIVAAILIFY